MFWSGYIGLAIGFVLLSAVVLWMVIDSRGKVLAKAVVIPATLWYSIALVYSVQNFMGWPSGRPLPADSRVLAVQIREPDKRAGDPGAIFLWVSTQKPETIKRSSWWNPLHAFNYDRDADPRAYKLPYSRQMHEMLLKAQQGMKKQPGSMMRLRKGRGGAQLKPGGSEQNNAPMRIEIINPLQMLPRKGAPDPDSSGTVPDPDNSGTAPDSGSSGTAQ